MRRFSLIIAAAFVTAGVVSCNKNAETPEFTTYTLTIDASKDGDITRALDLNGNKLNSIWGSNDVVTVCKGMTEIGTLTPQSTGSSSTTLKGTITTTSGLSAGTKLSLITPNNARTYNSQDGKLGTLSDDYNYASADVTVTSVSGSTIVASPASFENQQAIVKFTLQNASGGALKTKRLEISSAGGMIVRQYKESGPVYGDLSIRSTTATDVFYVALRNDASGPDTYTLKATVDNTVYTCTKSGTFEIGKYYAGTVKMEEEVEVWTVAGAPVSVFGKAWDPTYTANDMTKQNGLYVKSYNITSATEVSFKVVKDHDPSYTVAYPEQNWSHAVGVGQFKVIYDPSNNTAYAEYVDPGEISHSWTVAGVPASVFGTEWDPTNTNNDMTLANGVYSKTYQSVPSGTVLKFKVVADHDKDWTLNYGLDGQKNGPNIEYTMSATKDLTISFNPTSHVISATEK